MRDDVPSCTPDGSVVFPPPGFSLQRKPDHIFKSEYNLMNKVIRTVAVLQIQLTEDVDSKK